MRTWVVLSSLGIDDIPNKTRHNTHRPGGEDETDANLLAEREAESAQDEDGKEEEEKVGSDMHAADPELEFYIVDASILFRGNIGQCCKAPTACNGHTLEGGPE